MKTQDPKGAVVGCLILLLLSPLSAIWRGYVLSVLWAWFVAATFEIRPLSIPVAIGISAIASYLTYQYNVKEPDYESATSRTTMAVGMMVAQPAFALAFGWIVHQFQ